MLESLRTNFAAMRNMIASFLYPPLQISVCDSVYVYRKGWGSACACVPILQRQFWQIIATAIQGQFCKQLMPS